MSDPRVVVVVGTGTDVGKTHVSAALLRALVDGGVDARGWKPVASGVDSGVGDDALLLAEGARRAPRPPLHVFRPPVSPHLAAREAGVELRAIDLAAAAREACDVLLVETAGGLFSPLSDAETNADLVRALRPFRVLLVAPDRLGVLHDVRATLLAGRSVGVSVDALALSAPEHADASTGTNAAELGPHVPRVVPVPRAPAFDPASVAAGAAIARALSLTAGAGRLG